MIVDENSYWRSDTPWFVSHYWIIKCERKMRIRMNIFCGLKIAVTFDVVEKCPRQKSGSLVEHQYAVAIAVPSEMAYLSTFLDIFQYPTECHLLTVRPKTPWNIRQNVHNCDRICDHQRVGDGNEAALEFPTNVIAMDLVLHVSIYKCIETCLLCLK